MGTSKKYEISFHTKPHHEKLVSKGEFFNKKQEIIHKTQ